MLLMAFCRRQRFFYVSARKMAPEKAVPSCSQPTAEDLVPPIMVIKEETFDSKEMSQSVPSPVDMAPLVEVFIKEESSSSYELPQSSPSLSDGAPLIQIFVKEEPSLGSHSLPCVELQTKNTQLIDIKEEAIDSCMKDESRSDNLSKPPFSYPHLIVMAIENSQDKKLLLKDIFDWIEMHYPYYSNQTPKEKDGWKNCIRHTLSRSKAFMRLPNPNKALMRTGSYWTTDSFHRKKLLQSLTTKKKQVTLTASEQEELTGRHYLNNEGFPEYDKSGRLCEGESNLGDAETGQACVPGSSSIPFIDVLGENPDQTTVEHTQENSLAFNHLNSNPYFGEAAAQKKTKVYNCAVCDYKTLVHGQLRQHILQHPDYKPHKCSVCVYRAKKKKLITQHMLVHSNKKAFECCVCSSKFRYKHCLARHMLLHSDSKPFECSTCDYKTHNKHNLKEHVLVHSNFNAVQCSLCDYKTHTKSNLRCHMLMHNNYKAIECTMCDFKTHYRGKLQKHLLMHEKYEAIECSVCHFKALTKGTLKRHMVVHGLLNPV